MRLLLDTNIFLEILLEQQRAAEARALVQIGGGHSLFVSDFSVHSIGLKLFQRRKHDDFQQFLDEVLLSGVVRMLPLGHVDLGAMVECARRETLDFDDAYQYVVAEMHDLTIVSFDPHFDTTTRGRRTPAEILGALRSS